MTHPADVVAIFGPTASGKSRLAHALALAIGGEVIVADPFQRYRGLEIAADSPSERERSEVPYHFVGDLALHETSSAGAYSALAHDRIDAVIGRGHVPIVAGGSGLYVRAAICELGFAEPVPAGIREEAEALVRDDAAAALDRLDAVDAVVGARIDRQNPRRVARALELALAGRTTLASPSRLWTHETRRPTLVIGVERPRDVLDERIAARVERELDDGLFAELDAALDAPGRNRAVDQVIGMREVAAIRQGAMEAHELAGALAARTRRLARKQLTWMRKFPALRAIPLGTGDAAEAVPRVVSELRRTAL
ncbi:MAG: tRNA (adenosine(37)-N6)-dimethylallyltransferase MiaA [Actinobacteria bacterium]|nr:tRNA (adenosine(37)-N6)-dimethylallyltransferase MiaA [Actinomycetota bacterium]